MLVQLFICLMAITAASLLVTQGRRRRIWSVILLAGLGGTAWLFIEGINTMQASEFIYQWLPYDSLRADFNISSSLQMQRMFLPLVCLLAGSVYLNTFFADENHSLRINTLILLNFIALILLASSHDFIQLMFAGCITSVISFYIPDSLVAKKRFFIFNFLAEMAVFMALAIVYGTMQSVDLAQLSEYGVSGRHKDLVAVLLLFAVGGKCGLLLLNSQYFALKDISFNRIGALMSFSLPLSGLILADKLHILFTFSELPRLILPFWCLASIAAGLVTALFSPHLKIKAVALSLAAYAFMLQTIYETAPELYIMVPRLLILNFLAGMLFILAAMAGSNEFNPAYLGGFWRLTPVNFVVSLVLLLALCAGFSVYQQTPSAAVFAGLYLAVPAVGVKLVYLGVSRADEKVAAFAKNIGILYWLPLLSAAGWIFWRCSLAHNMTFAMLVLVVITAFLIPAGIILRGGRSALWHREVLEPFYRHLFVRPMAFLGRVLWLVFDVVVIERNIIGSLTKLFALTGEKLKQLQEDRAANYVFAIVAGLLIIVICLGFCANE